ncbi:MAG: SpaA isopeptide-forming pilin-related protein [Lachnospiraceae bacterium]
MRNQIMKRITALFIAVISILSIFPAQAFAATGDIGTAALYKTYDSDGNSIKYNSSAVINGLTAGGTGSSKYRIYVDGAAAFCIEPGAPLSTGNTLTESASSIWNALSSSQKKAVGLALLYGYQGNKSNLSGNDDEISNATQILVWEFVTGCRQSTGSYSQVDTTVYSLLFGSNYANTGTKTAYNQIVALLQKHNTIPSFMSSSQTGITKDLSYSDGKYSITLTDTNGVLSDYTLTCSDSNVSITKSGNNVTISSTSVLSGTARITATRSNVPTVSSSSKLVAYGSTTVQDVIIGAENADSVVAYINIDTPTGEMALKKVSEDGIVEGIEFSITGDNYQKTVKTGSDGTISIKDMIPGKYTITEVSTPERYISPKSQTITIAAGKTSSVTFENVLKRGSLKITKTSEDGLVEGMTFHLYGTSLSGASVNLYAVTDASGVATFEDVLISNSNGYTVEEVDTPIRYVIPDSQTAVISWNEVTNKSFDNILKSSVSA